MDAGEIKYCEGDGGGWYGAGTSVVMAKVEDDTNVFERHSFEMGSSPTLRKVSIHVAKPRNKPATCK